MTTPTAKSFREPLLRSLGNGTSLTADSPAAMNDVLSLVYVDSGVAENAHGKDKNGWFKTRLWVQQCYKTLVKQGLAIKAGRGKWGLSTEGVKVSALLLGVPVPIPAPVVAPVVAPAPAGDEDIDLDALLDEMAADDSTTTTDPGTNEAAEEAVEAPVAAAEPETASTPTPTVVPVSVTAHEGGEGVAFSLGKQTNTYNADPYIRGVAIESTTCFGEFSGRSEVCKTCPLSGACKATQVTRLSSIAALLRKRDVDAEKSKNAPATPAAPAEDIDDIIAAIEEEVEAPTPDKNSEIRRMKVPADGKCRECSGKIARGEMATYVRGTGIYHDACHQKQK
jgi:hypothetical protein